jgi:hypothetical protein
LSTTLIAGFRLALAGREATLFLLAVPDYSPDNYFDLLPGEAITVRVKSPAMLEQRRAAMKTISRTEAFDSD